jgi:hypothetical protein
VLRVTPTEFVEGQEPVFNPVAIGLAESELLSRTALSAMIQRPDLNLYVGPRKRIPLEDVIADTRQDIKIQAIRNVRGGSKAFSITYQYSDKLRLGHGRGSCGTIR